MFYHVIWKTSLNLILRSSICKISLFSPSTRHRFIKINVKPGHKRTPPNCYYQCSSDWCAHQFIAVFGGEWRNCKRRTLRLKIWYSTGINQSSIRFSVSIFQEHRYHVFMLHYCMAAAPTTPSPSPHKPRHTKHITGWHKSSFYTREYIVH